MTKISVGSFNGKEAIGTAMIDPDSAADCSIMGKHMMKKLSIRLQSLESPDQGRGDSMQQTRAHSRCSAV